MQKPWFRSSNLTWYVELPGGRQISLGKDERYTSPPKVKPKEPPPAIQKKYLEAMQARGEPEDRKLSFCVEEYAKSLDDCLTDTVRRARYFLKKFTKHCGDPKVSQLKAHHLTSFIKDHEWKPNTVRIVIATVNACLNHCVRQDWITKNPIKGKVPMPPAARREDMMSREDTERLLDAAKDPFKPILMFLAGTGCRPIEARELRIEKIDLERSLVMVRNKTRKSTGKQERPVFLSTPMCGLCRVHMGERKEGYLFLNRNGEKWTKGTLQRRMERLCEKLGIKKGARLYSSRHAFISTAINEKGINPAMVAIQAGHSNLQQLLKTYLHSDHAAMRRELDK